MACFQLAEPKMRLELIELWKVCFQESDEAVNCFFDYWFSPQNCAVCITQNGEIASALYMLPAQLVKNEARAEAHYIYAAATLPSFRGKGYMSGLLSFVNKQVAPQKGQRYSALLPAQASLYQYYRSQGYVNFFQTRLVTLDRNDLKAYAERGFARKYCLSAQDMYKIRMNALQNIKGTVLWNVAAISYAEKMNHIYGGKTIYSKEGYALCRLNGTVAEITEMMVEKEDFYHLLANIYEYMPARRYCFRLPCDSFCFSGLGKMVPFGMIRPLMREHLPSGRQNEKIPYLGLTLD